MTTTYKTQGNRKVMISKFAKHWEVWPFVFAPFIDDFVLFGGCEEPIFYTIYTKKDLNSFVQNYLTEGKIFVSK